MSTNQNAYWESIYTKEISKLPIYDGWLDEYIPLLSKCQKIVDLGCGLGVNTVHLHSLGIETIACDFSQSALDGLKRLIPNASVLCFDVTRGLPFLSESVDVVIADLSLHYFSDAVTRQIIDEIKRILRPDGLLLCRVNAFEDGFDPSSFQMIETDYFLINRCTKRFFTQRTLQAYFTGWQIIKVAKQKTQKYGFMKPTIFAEIRK